MPNQCKERGCEEKTPRLIDVWGIGDTITNRVVLPISGEVKFEDWMNGLCVVCIEAIKEFEEKQYRDMRDDSSKPHPDAKGYEEKK